jgi:hypothetical protein
MPWASASAAARPCSASSANPDGSRTTSIERSGTASSPTRSAFMAASFAAKRAARA